MSPIELSGAIALLANAISCNLSVEEKALLAGILVQLGDTVATIAAQESLCRENKAE